MRNTIFAGLALALACGSAQAGSFTTLDDAQNAFETGLSQNGRIVTGSYVGGGMYAGSFVWRKGVGSENSTTFGSSLGMNAWAQPIVGTSTDAAGNTVAALAYSDFNTNGPVVVGPYPGAPPQDNFYSQAYGVSDSGIVVGLAQDPTSNAIAFRWTAGGGMIRLAVDRPTTYSRANGISADGDTIYGWNDQLDGYRRGVIWRQGVAMDLHNPGMYGDSFGSPPGEALGANTDGTVVVGSYWFDDQMLAEAWRWTPSTGIQPIGIISPPPANGNNRSALAPLQPQPSKFADMRYRPYGFFYQPAAFALGVTADGNTIVGNTGNGQDNPQAFIWSPANGMVLLSDYAAAHNIAIPAGIFLLSANSITPDGKTIAGNALNTMDPNNAFIVPYVMDLDPAPIYGSTVIAQGVISSNNLTSGPFVGYPIGAAVSMSFTIPSVGTSVTPGRDSAYPVTASSFLLSATYVDTNYNHLLATETLDPAGTPMLHILNDNPRADGLNMAPTPTATSGQTFAFAVSNPGGVLFDSDEATRINRSFGPELFDTTTWTVSNGGQSMNVAVQWVTVKDSDAPDLIFANGFESN